MRGIQREAIDAYLDGIKAGKPADHGVFGLMLTVNDPTLRRWLIAVRLHERITEHRAATAELVTNDNPVQDTVVDVLRYRVEDRIRYATVRLAIDGDLDDVMCVEMPLHDLEIRRAA
ncbi:hypothetical protein [Prescottella equi]|uniref:Uncharacterized protein n=1 Tax=Rhodococcus phage REQ3 TaxID=1109714 RepID=G9FH64_9CAUD|nr:hypothetical protein [Prescottella equi]YP_005087209.1 hypothetical protein RoPhREQ3_gp17 [Rhodococcus phage REQ3]AEV51953.1 hypothetical protein [Rhodococcus phage REQ3]ORL29722.1 hypothetical protein A6I89_01820 [Prescottella equi]QPQ77287.1 hypothetical protein I6H09_00140 [Prescottella equi]SUE04859.1 Uncharacterised protein [Prescottella equi]SUE19701.1 Uncharacterised protein [Prescottella equi]